MPLRPGPGALSRSVSICADPGATLYRTLVPGIEPSYLQIFGETVETEPVTEVPTETASELAGEPELEATNLIEDELLVEEISIDGMCGVY